MLCISQLLQEYTIPLHEYLDDWLIIHGETREKVEAHTETLLHITQKVRFPSKPRQVRALTNARLLSYVIASS